MPQDIVAPANSIIVEDQGLVIEEFEIGANATPADMLPGTWVIYDTVAGNVKEGSSKVLGVVGILMEKPDGLLTDAYAVGDIARVITGGRGMVLSRIQQTGGAIAPGTPLVCGTVGCLKIAAVGAQGSQGEIVAIGQTVATSDTTQVTTAVVRIKKTILSKATA